MQVELSIKRNMSPWEPDDLLDSVVADVFCRSKSCELSDEWQPVLAARLAATRLDMDRVYYSDARLHDVFDARSGEFESLYAQIFDIETKEVKDTVCSECVHELIYIEHSVFHPSIRQWRPFIIDHFCELFGCFALIAIWDTTSHCTVDLSDEQLLDLGFARVADAEISVRSNTTKSAYRVINDDREPLNMFVPDSAEAYVQEQWRLIEADE